MLQNICSIKWTVAIIAFAGAFSQKNYIGGCQDKLAS